ncbi:MAG: hypothetical protein SP4CHLAM5_08360 [Chlamydiia bacterium]|nr:hypothetical protein [Chlamydiia bacterium]
MTKDMFDITDVDESAPQRKHLIAQAIVASLFEEEESPEKSNLEQELPKVNFQQVERGLFHLQTMSEFSSSSSKFIHEFIQLELGSISDLEVESFCSLPFRFFELDTKKYLVTETAIALSNLDKQETYHVLVKGLEAQLRLGLRSPFYARMVLEMKGGSVDGKTSYIQERVMRYIHRFPDRFDYDLIPLMNEYISTAKGSFLKDRSVKDLSTIILTLYFYNKKVEQRGGGARLIYVKTNPFYVEELFGRKKVLSVVLSLSYLSDNERLGAEHLLKASRKFIRGAMLAEDSFMKISTGSKKAHLFYFELEKKDGLITYGERQKIDAELSKYLELHIQKFARKIFMPQNTEEVIKYTVALSKELRTKEDFPQVAVLFDAQTNDSLLFTAIVVRANIDGLSSAFEIFSKKEEKTYSLKIGHVRSLGDFKEGIEVSYTMRITSFVRADYSVDIYRARARIIADLQKRFGVVRDYNGGMLEKQGGLLSECQGALRKKGVRNTVLIENFFYAMGPSEMRAILDVSSFSIFFLSFYDMFTYKVPKDTILDTGPEKIIFIARVRSEKKKEAFLNEIKLLDAPLGDMVFFTLRIQEKYYLGVNYNYRDEEKKASFIQKMSICLKL